MSLSLSHIVTIQKLQEKLDIYRYKNSLNSHYYNGTVPLSNMGINRPKDMQVLRVGSSFPRIAVDVLEQRINLQGFAGLGTEDIFFENQLEDEGSQVHIDTLTFGTGYVSVGKGGEGEPEILITPQSPNEMIGIRNPRTRRLDVALNIIYTGDGKEATGTLYLPNETIEFDIDKKGSYFQYGEANEHNLGRVPVYQFINRPSTSNRLGQSEITPVIKSHYLGFCTTLSDMEITRAYYGNPQKWIVNANREEFRTKDGKKRDPFTARADGIWVLGHGDNMTADGAGSSPTVGQFQTGNPSEHAIILDTYAKLMAQETGIPVNQFGLSTGNPPSAEGIYAQDARIIKRAERAITSLKRTWSEAAADAVAMKDGKRPDVREVDVLFGKPETPTRASTVDSVVKLVQSDVYDARGELTLAGLNLTTTEQEIWRRENSRAKTTELLTRLAEARGPLPTEE